MSEPTWTIHPDGAAGHRTTRRRERLDAERRDGETLEQFEERLSWGRLDELVVDWIRDLSGDGNPDEALAPPGTINTYRSDCNCYVLPGLGDLWLVDADYQTYKEWGHGIVAAKNIERFTAATRTLDSMITWAFYNDRWPIHVAPFGGREARSAFQKRKIQVTPTTKKTLNGRTKRKAGLISLHDCPAKDLAAEFGEPLGDAAAALWGEQARCLGDLPIVLEATGSRIATGYALHTSNFSLPTKTCHLRDQIDRSRPWAPPAGDLADFEPPMVLIKQKLPDGYTARLWDDLIPILQPILERADEESGGWLFAGAQPDNRRPLDAFERLYRDVRHNVGYKHTSQMHRHGYASWSLAPVDEGGYGWDVATVAECLGDNIDIVTKTYLHASKSRAGRSTRRRGRR